MVLSGLSAGSRRARMSPPYPVGPEDRTRRRSGKGCTVSTTNHQWNDDNLDHTSKLSAISPSDPVEEAEPGLTAQDRRAIENLPRGSALLVVRKGPNLGARFLLDADTTVAGRHPGCEIFLDDVTVSRRHAAFVRDGDSFLVRDLGSLNGTYLGKERVDEAVLQAGQDVQIGKYRLTFHPFVGTD